MFVCLVLPVPSKKDYFTKLVGSGGCGPYKFCVQFIFDSAFAVNELIKSCVLQPSFIILQNNSKTCNPFLMLDVFFLILKAKGNNLRLRLSQIPSTAKIS